MMGNGACFQVVLEYYLNFDRFFKANLSMCSVNIFSFSSFWSISVTSERESLRKILLASFQDTSGLRIYQI